MRKELHTMRVPRPGARALAVPILAIALAAAACAKGNAQTSASNTPTARPSTTAKLRIVSPTNGQVFHGASVDVPIDVALTGAKIVPATTKPIRPDQGHLHVYLDNQIVAMNFSVSGTVYGVKPGLHVLRVEFVASDHEPFDPRDFVEVTIEVKA